jgi:hypothetical protein
MTNAKRFENRNRKDRMIFGALGALTLAALALALPGCGQNRADVATETEAAGQEAPAPTPAEVAAAAELRAAEAEARAEEAEQRALEAEAAREREREARALEAARREVEQERRTRVLELPAVEPEPSAAEPAVAADDDAPRQPEPLWVTLPAATPLEVELITPLSSDESLIGDIVEAQVARDVVRDGLVAIPAGSRLSGTVSDVAAAKKIGGQARLSVDFDRLTTLDGQTVYVSAPLDGVARSQKKKDAATIGGSAAGGALLGRVLSKDDRSKGTVLGAIVGAAVGTAVAANNKADAVVFEPGTVAEVLLASPVDLAVNVDDAGAAYARN